MKKFILFLSALPIVGILSLGILEAQSASTVSSASGALVTSGAAPTLSACGGSPTVRGNNFGGLVTTGTGPLASCTLTFVPAFATAPACTLNDQSLVTALSGATTTTTLIITGSDITSDVIHYICVQVP